MEATSGNTGIGVAAMAIHRGYKHEVIQLCVPRGFGEVICISKPPVIFRVFALEAFMPSGLAAFLILAVF